MRSFLNLPLTFVILYSPVLVVRGELPPTESNVALSRAPKPSVADVEPRAADIATQPLAPGTRLIRTLVVDGVIVAEDREGAGAGAVGPTIGGPLSHAASSGEERLIYSNTLGRIAVDFGANRLISDDITTTALGGCALTRFSFDVDGRVNEALPGGWYTVGWALYTTCPYAVIAAQRNGRIVPGSPGSISFLDDEPRTIEVVFPQPISIPNHLWLGLTFNRANAGAIMGAPAMVGFTTDLIDFPGSACNASLGSFPTAPHASFNVQMWGADCPEVNLKYQNTRESGAAFNVGANKWLTDDITLLAEPCLMRGYSVGVRSPGTYNFELRESCEGAAIPGTQKTQIVGSSNGHEPLVFEYTFDPPIAVPREFVYAVKANNSGAGPIVTAHQAQVGETADWFAVELDKGTCEIQDLRAGQDALFFSVVCDGPAPVGACCDMFITQCAGGPLHGEPCGIYAEPVCSPGTCESVCREVPQLNCPFPPSRTELEPAWDEGKTCASATEPDGAFSGHVCGQAACCTPNDICLNLTKNECDAYPPADGPYQWQVGRFCGEDEQHCPFAACLHSPTAEVCYFDHDQPGCSDSECCQSICSVDPWCCRVEWDRACVERADTLCPYLVPMNDTCGPIPTNLHAGATPVESNASVTFTNRWAERDDQDYTACTLVSEYRCLNDVGVGLPCDPSIPYGGCTSGYCTYYDWPAFNTVWFKFTASHSSAQIGTCNSPPSLSASLHVFAVDDLSAGQEPCDHLSLVSCTAGDGCGITQQACLCVEGLTVGEEYYIMVGSHWDTGGGVYQLDITSPCSSIPCCPRQDCNQNCIFDAAEPDCDDNDIPDECDVRDESRDCNSDGILDPCDNKHDCDHNQVPDECDLREPGVDCNKDGLLDRCDREGDCDGNHVVDECELEEEAADCNSDGTLDRCVATWVFDADMNFRIDMRDFAAFQRCFDPEPVAPLGCCYIMDSYFALDGVIDLADYPALRTYFEE